MAAGVISCATCRTPVIRYLGTDRYCAVCDRIVSTVIVVPPGASSLPFDWIEPS